MNRLEHDHLCKMYGVVINDIPPSLQLASLTTIIYLIQEEKVFIKLKLWKSIFKLRKLDASLHFLMKNNSVKLSLKGDERKI